MPERSKVLVEIRRRGKGVRGWVVVTSTNNPRTLAKVLSAIVKPANTSTDSNVEEIIKMTAIAD